MSHYSYSHSSWSRETPPSGYAAVGQEPRLEWTPDQMVDGSSLQQEYAFFSPNGADVYMQEDDSEAKYYLNVLGESENYEDVRPPSNNSIRTSGGESEELSYSPPSAASAEWTVVANYAVKHRPEILPQNHRHLLPDLSTSEPRIFYSPHQEIFGDSTAEEAVYQGTTEYDVMDSTNPPRTFDLPRRPHNANDGFEAPWSHVEPYRVSSHDTGDVAFADSPQQHPEQVLGRFSEPAQVSSDSDVKAPKKKRGSTKATPKGKERSSEPGWEHVVVGKRGLEFLTDVADEEASRRGHGRRKQPLNPEIAAKARRVRKIKACWRCWILKVDCSDSQGRPCDRCVRISPLEDRFCCRSGFKDYEVAFFPEYLHSHLEEGPIKDFITQNVSRFTDTALKVDISTGQYFPPLRLWTYVCRAKTAEVLTHHHLKADAQNQNSQLVLQCGVPVGLIHLSTSELKSKCREHIEGMISSPEYPSQATAGDRTTIRYEILTIAQKYCASKDPGEYALVRNALMLHAQHYFMGHVVTFSTESAQRILREVPRSGFAPDRDLSSRLLNRQVKYGMLKLQREITKDVLEGLEKSMRSRGRDSWGPSFIAILVLCLCMEDLQTAADTFVVCDMQYQGPHSKFSREQSLAACTLLDEYPFQQCTRLFHDIYKSHKESHSGKREGAFNPLQAGGEVDAETGWDQATEDMVFSMRQLVWHSYPELLDLAERPTVVNFGYAVEAEDIKANATGRLAAKFLTSFF